MIDSRPPRSLSPIARWMIAIAAIAGLLGTMVVAPVAFIVVVVALMETLASVRYREIARRGPMPAWKLLLWIFTFLVAIPIAGVVSAAVALSIYCTMNPNANNW